MNYAGDAGGADSVVSAITSAGGKAIDVRADVASESDVEAMFDRAAQQMGPVTALVSNAGQAGEQARVDEPHSDALARLMQVEAGAAGPDRPSRRDRIGGVVAGISGGIVRHRC